MLRQGRRPDLDGGVLASAGKNWREVLRLFVPSDSPQDFRGCSGEDLAGMIGGKCCDVIPVCAIELVAAVGNDWREVLRLPIKWCNRRGVNQLH